MEASALADEVERWARAFQQASSAAARGEAEHHLLAFRTSAQPLATCAALLEGTRSAEAQFESLCAPVSYTHLTLPTKWIV